MSGHTRPEDDRDLDIWVQEVTETWRMPRLRSDQMSWRARVDRSGSTARFAGVSAARVVGAMAAAAVVALASVMLVSSLPVAPDPGTGGRGSDAAASPSHGAASSSATSDPAPSGEGRDALFRLTIGADRGRYAADEPIEIAATLRYIAGAEATVTSSGSGLVVFGIEQLDGPVDAIAGRDEACQRYEYRPREVESVEFQKSGGYSNDDPMAGYWRRFFADPELRLPAGKYRITATAEYGDPDCGGWRTLEASIVIAVE
jgi:hypothetical protein